MRIKDEYYISYDEDDISVVRRLPDGGEELVTPISATAAMAWEGFARGLAREALIDSIVGEFDGADAAGVAADLDALAARLIALGFAEE